MKKRSEATEKAERVCDRAESGRCPMPRTCRLARPHACDCRPGDCLLANGRTMAVQCVSVRTGQKGKAT